MEIFDLPVDAFSQLEYLTLRGCDSCYGHHRDIGVVERQNLVSFLRTSNLKALSLGYDANLSWYAPPSDTGLLPMRCVHVCMSSPLDWYNSLQHQFIALHKGYLNFLQPAAGSTPISVANCSTLEELAFTYGMMLSSDVHYDCFYPLRMFRFSNLRRLQITFRNADIEP